MNTLNKDKKFGLIHAFLNLPGLLSKAQKEELGAETELVHALQNEEEMEERERNYEIDKRDSRNNAGCGKWLSSCPSWRYKTRTNDQVAFLYKANYRKSNHSYAFSMF